MTIKNKADKFSYTDNRFKRRRELSEKKPNQNRDKHFHEIDEDIDSTNDEPFDRSFLDNQNVASSIVINQQ